MAGQVDHADGSGLPGPLGAKLAHGFEFGPPGGAMLGEPSLEGTRADRQAAGQHLKRGAVLLDHLVELRLEVPVPAHFIIFGLAGHAEQAGKPADFGYDLDNVC
jgi:hypothetical protein